MTPWFIRQHSYPADLQRAWADATAPRAPDAPTVISTFAGRGGSSTGYHMAGFHELLAVEWDGHAADTLRLNYPSLDVYHGDIAQLSVAEVLRRTGLQPGELDLFDGSPPCFPAGSPVITTRGTVPIEQLCVGDLVLTHTGAYQPVQEVMARPYKGATVTLHARYGRRPITCTPEHPFWARRRQTIWNPARGSFVRTFSAPEWIAAHDVRPGDLLCEPHAQQRAPFPLPKLTFQRMVNVEGQSGRDRRERRLDEQPCVLEWRCPQIAWLLGMYVAEGHVRGRNPTLDMRGPNRREVVYSVAHHEAAELVERLAAVGLHGVVAPHGQGVTRVSVSNPDFWAICSQVGHGAAHKFIPEAFQGMPLTWQTSFLDGYFAGDGCIVTSKRVRSQKRKATTVSRQLAQDISRMIASTQGVVATLEKLYSAGKRQIQGRTVNVRDTFSVGYVLTGSGRPRPAFVEDGHSWIPVGAVTPGPSISTVYNLEVAEDHSYTVGGFAVHNCQGFSMTGTRQLDDPRNQLFREFVRLLDGLQPRVFVMENVRGMVTGKMIQIYQEALDALRGAGPGYRTVSGLINAKHLGVPQSRTRLIVIGVREDLGIQPTLPAPQTRPITVRQALHGLPDVQEGAKLHQRWLPVLARTGDGRSFKDLHPLGHMFSHTKIHPDKPAPTILKTVGVQRDGRANNGLYHWRWPRLMTIPELKRLGSFPDAYQFATTGNDVDDFVNAWNGIGNSVPPLMTRAIAQHIRQTLF
ncbi:MULTISPECIES: DNA cytosine methyltransferase [unclassified Deinococcus]|uniref:DNA cytosine methyltransferase n=1 Tax=unclassified Deinococcus TaxID=2623546 RepID=UPI001C2FF59F|nr:DNA cytosine methyltransferase [Deinococcus sp. 43]MDK2013555.1 DNA cytosine methyltransferase [Deinococcus sp. 43]